MRCWCSQPPLHEGSPKWNIHNGSFYDQKLHMIHQDKDSDHSIHSRWANLGTPNEVLRQHLQVPNKGAGLVCSWWLHLALTFQDRSWTWSQGNLQAPLPQSVHVLSRSKSSALRGLAELPVISALRSLSCLRQRATLLLPSAAMRHDTVKSHATEDLHWPARTRLPT